MAILEFFLQNVSLWQQQNSTKILGVLHPQKKLHFRTLSVKQLYPQFLQNIITLAKRSALPPKSDQDQVLQSCIVQSRCNLIWNLDKHLLTWMRILIHWKNLFTWTLAIKSTISTAPPQIYILLTERFYHNCITYQHWWSSVHLGGRRVVEWKDWRRGGERRRRNGRKRDFEWTTVWEQPR